MSGVENPPPAAPPEPPPIQAAAAAPPQRRNGCVTAFLVLVGVLLLLPGLCTMSFLGGHFDPAMSPIALITFLIALGGIGLIVLALSRPGL